MTRDDKRVSYVGADNYLKTPGRLYTSIIKTKCRENKGFDVYRSSYVMFKVNFI